MKLSQYVPKAKQPLPPPPLPGRTVRVPIDRWGEYMRTYGLETVRMDETTWPPTVYVRRKQEAANG